jgi:hypothetical protein
VSLRTPFGTTLREFIRTRIAGAHRRGSRARAPSWLEDRTQGSTDGARRLAPPPGSKTRPSSLKGEPSQEGRTRSGYVV